MASPARRSQERKGDHPVRRSLNVPTSPSSFIEGDGTGPDIWRLAARLRRAVEKRTEAAGRSPGWRFTREERARSCSTMVADETSRRSASTRRIKGPLTTPVGGESARSTSPSGDVDPFVCCARRWFKGVPSPVKAPRRSTCDLRRIRRTSTRIEYAAGTPEAQRISTSGRRVPEGVQEDPVRDAGGGEAWQKQLEVIGTPGARRRSGGNRAQAAELLGTERLVHSAITTRCRTGKSVTLVHKATS